MLSDICNNDVNRRFYNVCVNYDAKSTNTETVTSTAQVKTKTKKRKKKLQKYNNKEKY